MPYGKIQKLLAEHNELSEMILVESPFAETTRQGSRLQQVHLGITPSKFVIASERRCGPGMVVDQNAKSLEMTSLYPIQCVNLSVFKCSQRQTLKASLKNNLTRYFELGDFEKRQIFWKIWCARVSELNSKITVWPFVSTSNTFNKGQQFWDEIEGLETRRCNEPNEKQNTLRWIDKDLFLGDQRFNEDKSRPVPIAGLGPTEEIKLLYLKRQPSSQFDNMKRKRSRHEDALRDYDVYTYTGEPTSNVTYTSIMNTVNSGNKDDQFYHLFCDLPSEIVWCQTKFFCKFYSNGYSLLLLELGPLKLLYVCKI